MIKAPQSGQTAIAATLIDRMGTDLSVVNAARVSFGKKSEWDREYVYGTDCHGAYEEEVLSLSDKDAKLIKYLACLHSIVKVSLEGR